jgi:hypothetical protein
LCGQGDTVAASNPSAGDRKANESTQPQEDQDDIEGSDDEEEEHEAPEVKGDAPEAKEDAKEVKEEKVTKEELRKLKKEQLKDIARAFNIKVMSKHAKDHIIQALDSTPSTYHRFAA